LKNLFLSNNQLTDLPQEIGQLTQLEYLDISDNQLTKLPQEIGQLTQLTNLYLSNNQLTEFPQEIRQLRYLALNGNPIPEDITNQLKIQLPNCNVWF
jgi:Leucine-rich repeat (LRR) protein